MKRAVKSTRKKAPESTSGASRTSAKLIQLPPRSDIHPLDRAISELRAQLSRNPDDAVTLNRLGALYYRRGDLEQAEKHLRQAIALAPRRPNIFNNLGNVLCDQGRMRDGIAAYEQALAIERAETPGSVTSPEAQMNLDMAKAEFKLIHERIEYLERAAQLDVASAEALNALGCGYLLRGSRVKALETFRQAAKLDPRNLHAVLNVGFAHTLSLDEAQDFADATAEVAEALVRFPREGRLHIHMAELMENGGLLEEAQERYVRAIETSPLELDAYELLGKLRAAQRLDDSDDFAQDVKHVLAELSSRAAKAPEAEALFLKAFVRIAGARFARTPIQEPEETDRWLRESLNAELSRATPGEEKSVGETGCRAGLLRARLLETDGRSTEARVALEALAPKTAPAFAGLVAFERAMLALRSGDIDDALRCFDQATLNSPQDARAYHSLRFAFEGFRRYYTERVRFTSSIRQNAHDSVAHYHLALAAMSVMKDEEALFNFTRALELDPKLSDAASGRGKALLRQGHFQEAESAFKQALEIDPGNVEAKRALAGMLRRKAES